MNKKLIKTIASVTCGLGIVSSIPFIATSCGQNWKYLPYNGEDNVYYYEGGYLCVRGFTEQFLEMSSTTSPFYNEYKKNYNAMKLPTNSRIVSDYAFYNNYNNATIIPEYVKYIDFSSIASIGTCAFGGIKTINTLNFSENMQFIYEYAFRNCINLTSVSFSNQIKLLQNNIFNGCTKLNKIIIDGWTQKTLDLFDTNKFFYSHSFDGINSTGTIVCTNTKHIKEALDSNTIFDFLKSHTSNEGVSPFDGWQFR